MPTKKAENEPDELRPEYDFASMSGGVRGKYLDRAMGPTNVVVLDDDVVQAFPTQESVNQALRMLAKVAQATAESG